MSLLSNFLKKAAPFVAAAAPGTPIGTVAAVKTVADAKAQQKFLNETARANNVFSMQNDIVAFVKKTKTNKEGCAFLRLLFFYVCF